MDKIKTPNFTSTEEVPAKSVTGLESPVVNAKISTIPKAAKPLLEGINTPAVVAMPAQQNGINLTEQEKKLIDSPLSKQKTEEPRLIPRPQPVATGSKSRGFGMFIAGLLVASAVWGGIVWLEKPQIFFSMNNLFSSPAQTPDTNLEDTKSVIPEELLPVIPPIVTTSTPENIPPSEPVKQTELKIKTTPTGYLNVRSEPSTTGLLVSKVLPGETYTYTSKSAGWHEILLPENKTGWVISTYIDEVPSN